MPGSSYGRALGGEESNTTMSTLLGKILLQLFLHPPWQHRGLRLAMANMHTNDVGQSFPCTSAFLTPHEGRTIPTIPQFPKSSVSLCHVKPGKIFKVLSKHRIATGLLIITTLAGDSFDSWPHWVPCF